MTSTQPKPYAFNDPLYGARMKPMNPEQERHEARLAICQRAVDAEEARLFMDMAGVLPDGVAPPAKPVERPLGKRSKAGPFERLDAAIAELHAQGLTVAAIAERLGINSQQVTRWKERVAAEEARGGRAARFETGWEGK